MRSVLSMASVIILSLVIVAGIFPATAQDGQRTEPSMVLGKYGGLADFAWSPDSSTLAVSTYTGIVLYDKSLNEIGFLEPPSEIKVTANLKWSPNGTKLLSVDGIIFPIMLRSNEAYIWDISAGEIQYTFVLTEDQQAQSHTWNSAGDMALLSVSNTSAMQNLMIWNSATGEINEIDITELGLRPDTQWHWSDDEQHLMTIVDAEQISISIADPTKIEKTAITSADQSIFISPDNNHQAIREDGVFVITNANGQQFELAGDEGGRFTGLREITWSENSQRVAVWGRGVVPNLMVADVLTGEILLEFIYDQAGSVVSAQLNPDGSAIAIRTLADELFVYDLATGDQTQRWLKGVSTAVSFSPDGSKIASVNASNQHVYIWDTATGEELEVWETPNDPKGTVNNIFTIAWSPDGKYVATGSMAGGPVENGTERRPIDLFIWSAETGDVIQQIPALTYDADIIAELNWSDDSQILAYSTISNLTAKSHIGVYNLQTEELNFQIPLEVSVWDIALHPAGDVLALTWLDLDRPEAQQITFVDVQTGELLEISTPEIEATIRSLDWHPSGDYLAALIDRDDFAQVQIWSWQTDVPLGFYLFFDLEGEAGRSSLEWNAQGTQLATWYFGEENAFGVQVWNIDLAESIANLNNIFLPDYPSYFLPFASHDALDWSADGTMLATSLSQNTSSVWEVPTE